MAFSSRVSHRDASALRLQLPNAMEITVALDGERVLGIRDVQAHGVALRNPAKLWRPVITTPEGMQYLTFLLRDVIDGAEGEVTLVMDAVGTQAYLQEALDEYLGDMIALPSSDEPVIDRLEWEFQPSALELDGRRFAGFSYRYHFTGASGRKIYRIFDDATWEIGGHVDGNTLLCQGQVNPPVTELRKEDYFTTACNYYGAEMRGVQGKPSRVSIQRLPRIGVLQAFDFMAHARGILLNYFDPTMEVHSLIQKDFDEDLLHVLDELRRPLAEDFHSHPKHVLFHPLQDDLPKEEIRNTWARALDFVYSRERTRAGITPSPVLPRVWLPQVSRDMAEFGDVRVPRERYLEYLAEKVLPIWAEMGVKELCAPSFWVSDYTVDRYKKKDDTGMHGALMVSGICCVRVHEIDPLYGGPRAVARLTRRAHELGMQIQLWWATHLSRRAPIYRERPDFMAIARDGHANGGGYGRDSIITLNLANPECVDWIFNKLKAVYEATGVDGLFHDSYGNMTFLPVNYADPQRLGQQEGFEGLLARLQALGLRTMTIEGLGPFGVGHFGMNLLPQKADEAAGGYQNALDWWIGQEDMIYGLNMGIGQGVWPEREEQARQFAFRCLAAGGNFGFTQHADGIEKWSGWLREQRQLHARLAPVTGKRTLLPGDRGVCWERPEGDELLFTFQAFTYPLPAGVTAVEVTPTGETPVRRIDGNIAMEPWRVYRIT
ncbi:MAG: alpha-amylase family protein [Armatimonadota bacterium]